MLPSLVFAGTATNISGLYRTGQETHVENWWLNIDDHWTASNSEGKAYAVIYPPSGWATAASADWISAGPMGYPGGNVNYTYALTFDITGSGTGAVNNAAITLTLYVDDAATILVNGKQATAVSGTNLYKNPTTLTLSSGFVIGSNTISISVANAGGATGVMVSSITGAVPETGAWIPVAIMIGAFAWFRLHRKRHALPAAV
ncbi:MAG: hypothetical protein QM790_14035 [Nibricoccus sp.]